MPNEEMTHLIHSFFICFGSWMRYQFKSQLIGDYNLSVSQFKVLYSIKNLKICNMSNLSDEMEVSKGTMTTTLNKLVEDGFVKRSSSPKDRRTVYVELTDKGQWVVKELEEQLQISLLKTIQQLNVQQQDEILAGLSALNQIFKDKKCRY